MRFALLVTMLAGCGPELPSSSFIDKLRILAVRAEPPEIAPGTTTTIDALTVEPPAHAAPIQRLWLVCKQPPDQLSPIPCGVGTNTFDTLGTDEKASYTPDASVLGSDMTGQVLLTLVASDASDGPIGCLKSIAASGDHFKDAMHADHCVVAYKRLTVNGNPGATPNHNPSLAALTIQLPKSAPQPITSGGATFPVATDKSSPQLTLDATRADGAAELVDGKYEALALSWFTSGGKLNAARSTYDPPGCDTQAACADKAPATDATTTWNSPTADHLATVMDADGAVHFWAVLRDDRGGVSWLEGTAKPQ
jgi:hypothetical protein